MTQDAIQDLIKAFKVKKQAACNVERLLDKRAMLENKGGSPEAIARLDREIDALGGEEALDTEKDLNELIHALCTHSTESAKKWKELESKRIVLEKELAHTQKILNASSPVLQELRLAAKQKKGSLIGLIFGRHPTVRRAHHIAATTQAAKRIVTTLDKLEKTPLEQEIMHFCERFITESEKAFNKDLYGKKIEWLSAEFDKLFTKLEAEEISSNQKIQALDEAVDAWIETGYLG